MGTAIFSAVVFVVVILAMLVHDVIVSKYPSLPERVLGRLPILNRPPEGVRSAQLRQAAALLSELVHGTFNITPDSKAAAQDWLKRAAQPQPEDALLDEARVLMVIIETEHNSGAMGALTTDQQKAVTRWLDTNLDRR